MCFTMARFPAGRSSDQLTAPWKDGGTVMTEVSCQKSSHVHGQEMEDAQEEHGGDILSAYATGDTGAEIPLFWCPVLTTTCLLVGSRMHKPALSPQGVMVS